MKISLKSIKALRIIALILFVFVSENKSQTLVFTIKGTITENQTSNPVEKARITFLEPVSRDTLLGNIFTDQTGFYEANLQIKSTGLENRSYTLPDRYIMSDIYPNPVTEHSAGELTLQYFVPDNDIHRPSIEVYNILGRRVDINKSLSKGIYFYRLKFDRDHFSKPKKLLLLSDKRFSIHLERMNITDPGQKNHWALPKAPGEREVLIVIQKTGYFQFEKIITINSNSDNINNFSIEILTGTEKTIGPEGGTVSLSTGLVELVIPEGALTAPVNITIKPDSADFENPWSVKGTEFVFGPDGLKFNKPAQLSLSYNTVNLPAGVPQNALNLHKLMDSTWQVIPGTVVDSTARKITTPISSFSRYIISVPPPQLILSIGGVPGGLPLGRIKFDLGGRTSGYEWVVLEDDEKKTDISPFPFFPASGNDCGFYTGGQTLSGGFLNVSEENEFTHSYEKDGLLYSDFAGFGNLKYTFTNKKRTQFDLDWSDVVNPHFMHFEYNLLSQPEPYPMEGLAMITDIYAEANFGMIDPSYQETRRLLIDVYNPSGFEFDLLIRWMAEGGVDGDAFIPMLVADAEIMLQDCGQQYKNGQVITLYNLAVSCAPWMDEACSLDLCEAYPDLCIGSDSFGELTGGVNIEKINRKHVQLSLGARATVHAEARDCTKASDQLLCYGDKGSGTSAFTATFEILAVPRSFRPK